MSKKNQNHPSHKLSIFLLLSSASILILSFVLVQSTPARGLDLGRYFAQVLPTPNLFLPFILQNVGSTPAPSPTLPPTLEGTEWTQHAHDAQHTGYTDQAVETPWRWKWSWNGPNSSGGVSGDKTSLPRNVQPITGGGRVYVTRGIDGIYALNQADGSEMWSENPGGSMDTTPAYDPSSGSVYVNSTNGYIYRLDASNGNVIDSFNTGSSLTTPPALIADRLFVSSGTQVFAINKISMDKIWSYDAGSLVQTPPAYSASNDRVVVGTQDLYVHAINNSNGTRAWRVKPTVHNEGDTDVEYLWGWPVIADNHGLVLMKLRLDWNSIWTWDPYPTTNSEIRQNLQSQPGQQSLFAINIQDGSIPFICNIGNGGWGDGGYLPMGPQPVVKHFPDNSEVVYTVGRGGGSDALHDARWDSLFVEMLLDNQTVPGYSGGEVRFIEYNHVVLTDEQPFVSMAGNYLLGGHWMAGYALKITDRSDGLGAWDISNRIQSVDAPHIVASQEGDGTFCNFSSSHYCPNGLMQDQDNRTYPPGFYIYYNAGTVYNGYWSRYSSWIESNGLILFRSSDGAIVALEHGNPTQSSPASNTSLSASLPQPTPKPVLGEVVDNPGAQDRPSRGPLLIDYTEARQHVGEIKSVQGTIRYTFNNGKAFYLGFKNPHQGAFAALIPVEYLDKFASAPENLFRLGDQVTVTGKIVWYQGDPVIYVSEPNQIEQK